MARSFLAPGMLTAVAAACGSSDGSARQRWIALAEHYRPRPIAELALRLEERVQPPRDGRVVRAGKDGAEAWFELPLRRGTWKRDDEIGAWRRPLPEGGALLAGETRSLLVADGALVWAEGRPKEPAPGHFWSQESELWVSAEPGFPPPDTLVLRVRLDLGHALDGRWRVAERDLACEGFRVFPGLSETLTLDLPPASQLSLATVAPDPDGRGETLAPTTFRVRLDGRVLLEHVQPFTRPVRSAWHRIALDASGPHELTFEVEGEAPALIATPCLQPTEVGRTGERPWSDPRPDVVLLLCDTFRADNLAAWGGKPELAPNLNRLVERSLCFLDARSVAGWTLPSIASILSGVFPGQHGGIDLDRTLLPEAETIAEVLSRAGYRTAAVTDAGFFSRHFGQDQGFEWFEEVPQRLWDLQHTLARTRARMAADDGRPLFLVVHTYRVHGPMRVGADEDPQPARASRAELERQMDELVAKGEHEAARALLFTFASSQGQSYYEDAVADLDRKLGVWLQELEQARFFERAHLVLTSDHGNSRGEHGQIGHGGELYDVELRVPLAIAGRGITPRAIAGPISLIDLAPTLAALAGVEPSPTWMGRSLLARTPAGPIYAFHLGKRSQHVVVYNGTRKVMARSVQKLREGSPSHAFDLERDPGENENLLPGATWPAELGRDLAGALEPLLVPLGAGGSAELSEDVLEELRDLGYGR